MRDQVGHIFTTPRIAAAAADSTLWPFSLAAAAAGTTDNPYDARWMDGWMRLFLPSAMGKSFGFSFMLTETCLLEARPGGKPISSHPPQCLYLHLDMACQCRYGAG